MAEYNINSVDDKGILRVCGLDENEEYVGLFKGGEWKGEGHCCGWYGAEYYVNTKLLAVYRYEYKYDNKLSRAVIINRELDKVRIGSIYHQIGIEADNEDEAIEKFKNLEFVSE